MSRVKFDEREWLAKGFSRVTVELVRNLYTRTGGSVITLNNDELETLLHSLPNPDAQLHELRARLDALERATTHTTGRLAALQQRLDALERIV